jgi:hypothetical protein
MTPEQGEADVAYCQMVTDIGGDEGLAGLAQAAYGDGEARARKELDPYV